MDSFRNNIQQLFKIFKRDRGTTPSAQEEVKEEVCETNPFVELHLDVKWKILKQLEYRDFFNVALTCRTCYQSACSAPDSLKTMLTFNTIEVKPPGLVVDENKIFDHMLSVDLAQKVVCKVLIVDIHKRHYELASFVYENRSKFEYDRFVVIVPFTCERTASLMYTLAAQASELLIKRRKISKRTKKCRLEKRKFVETCLTYSRIAMEALTFYDIVIANIILKQWTRGERPNLQYVVLCFEHPATQNFFDDALDGLEMLTYHKLYYSRDGECSAELEVIGLPTLDVSYCYRVLKIERRG